MEIRNVKTFLRVAELESFTNAAEQLGYSQAAVTVQIKQLESELETQLFDRVGKHIKLTETGVRFMPYATEVMKAVHKAETFIQGEEILAGRLRIGSVASLAARILPPILLEYRELYPHVEMSIETLRSVPEMFDMVRQNEIDILYFLNRQIYSFEWVKVLEHPEDIIFVTHACHPLAGRERVNIEQILREPLILTMRGISYCGDLEQTLAARGLEAHPFLEIGDTEVIIEMLLNKAGISFLPQYLVQKYIDSGQLASIGTDLPPIENWSQLVYHKNKYVTPQMKAFIDLVKKHVDRINDYADI